MTTKSVQLKVEISRLEQSMERDRECLSTLRETLQTVVDQEYRRQAYVSSREIVALIETRSGRKVDLSTIKRWSDKGYLGPVYDERKLFPALDAGSGKQRFVYERETVMQDLYERGYIEPRYIVLDRVFWLHPTKPGYATILRHSVHASGFTYTIQPEDGTAIREGVPEHELVEGSEWPPSC